MFDDEELAKIVRSEIKDGCLPSILFRRLLREHEGLEKYAIGSVLQESFPNADGVVWNIFAHWQASQVSDYWDTRMNISLIDELLNSSEQIPWDRQYIEMEWSRIEVQKNDASI